MFTDWIRGVLLRPGATFARAEHELRFDYLWILLCTFTIEAVMSLYGPVPSNATVTDDGVVFGTVTTLLFIFEAQAVLFWGSARLFRWQLSWRDAPKYLGLAWSIFLVEDIVTFYPFMKNMGPLLKWVDLAFMAWYICALTAGVRRLSGQAVIRSFLITALATVPWWGSLFWLGWVRGQ